MAHQRLALLFIGAAVLLPSMTVVVEGALGDDNFLLTLATLAMELQQPERPARGSMMCEILQGVERGCWPEPSRRAPEKLAAMLLHCLTLSAMHACLLASFPPALCLCSSRGLQLDCPHCHQRRWQCSACHLPWQLCARWHHPPELHSLHPPSCCAKEAEGDEHQHCWLHDTPTRTICCQVGLAYHDDTTDCVSRMQDGNAQCISQFGHVPCAMHA
jgi:hypothetical protein